MGFMTLKFLVSYCPVLYYPVLLCLVLSFLALSCVLFYVDSFQLEAPIFTGSQVTDEHPYPSCSMYSERQLIIVAGGNNANENFNDHG